MAFSFFSCKLARNARRKGVNAQRAFFLLYFLEELGLENRRRRSRETWVVF